MTEKRKKVAIYINSTDNNEIKLILAKLHNFIYENGHELYKDYIDNDETQENLSKLLLSTIKKRFDIILVWDISHIGDSLRDLNTVIKTIENRNINLIAINNQLNTLTQGRLVFSLINELIRFESKTKKRRIKEGIKEARKKGKKLGRPQISENVYEKAKELRPKGLSYRQIGKLLNVNEGTVRKRMKEEMEKRKAKN